MHSRVKAPDREADFECVRFITLFSVQQFNNFAGAILMPSNVHNA